MDVFTALHGQGKTIIMVTHEEDIASYAQRILRMRDGKLEKDEKR
jgi:ABC-type lipoprotein export system ATPase subunit